MTAPCVELNKVISITYRINDEDGTLLEQIDVPISYVHGGEGRLFKKIEKELEGHISGDMIEVSFTPAEGFGEVDPSLTFTDELENVPEQFRHVGAEVEMQNEQGETRVFKVMNIKDGKLTVDCNHPLAGKTVLFSVLIVEIRDATQEEIESGSPAPTVGSDATRLH